MAAAKGKLLFFFDCVSPYSYIGFENYQPFFYSFIQQFQSLLQYEERLPFTIEWRPVFNGIIMKKAGNEAPASLKRKSDQMFRDLGLVADFWTIPYKNVTDFHGRVMKKRSTPALRFLTASRLHDPDRLKLAIRTLFTTLYVDDRDIFEEADVRKTFDRINFTNRNRLYDLMQSPEIKEELTAQTNQALDFGAFGVPWLVLQRPNEEDVILFGSDRLPVLCQLAGVQFDGPLGLAKV